jgi:hypothetical protein
MGQTAGGRLIRTCGRSGIPEEVPFDKAASPFTLQASAFQAAAQGAPHGWCCNRDLRLMRLFDIAYQEALLCL